MGVDKMSHSRVAFALLCGLAICASVMYVTADGADIAGEVVLAAKDASSPSSVSSMDVEKAGTIFTNTPDGRMRLTDYLANVEKEIVAEEAARKRDVDAVRAQMARNFAFNKAARAKLKTALLARMAKNAEAAKKHLADAMRRTQAKFAAAAKLQNKRHKEEDANSKSEEKAVKAAKHQATKDLAHATLMAATAMSTLKDKVNKRIKSTNKDITQNSNQMAANAKAAHADLEKMTNDFDTKAAKAAAGAKAGRSKLQAQLITQDKATRAYANNKLKVVIAQNAAKFGKLESAMAAERKRVDLALTQASGRMTASLNAEAALRDKQFQKTVKDIASAKSEAKKLVSDAKTDFNAKLLDLRATVNHQAAVTKQRIQNLAGVVDKKKLAQAKVNANVEAEQARMLKLGNNRYAEHLKKDKELNNLVKSNKAATDKRMKQMAAHYTMEMDSVRAQMKKNNAHAAAKLAEKTAALYSEIAKAEKAQTAVNAGLIHQSKQAKIAIKTAAREAKAAFTRDLGGLSDTVARNDRKFDGKMKTLTGVTTANRELSKNEQIAIKALQKANKANLMADVNEAISVGTARMKKAQDKLTAQNKKSELLLQQKVQQQISDLRTRAHGQIDGVRMESKAARAEMLKELLGAVKDSAEEAKKNLDAEVGTLSAAFTAANDKEDKANGLAAAARGKLGEEITAQKDQAASALKDAVGTMEGALLALKTSTKKKIAKTNTNVAAYAQQLEDESKAVKDEMATSLKALEGSITAQAKAAALATGKAASAAEAESKVVAGEIAAAMKAAAKASDDKFAGLYETMSKNRKKADEDLAGAVIGMNANIAKQAALADERFKKTVKDIAAAQKEAKADVALSRKQFATKLLVVTSKIKAQETRLAGETAKQATVVQSEKAAQLTINRRTTAEHKRILGLVNQRQSESERARGLIRKTLDEYKRAASEETAALDTLFQGKVKKIRSRAAAISIAAAEDLSSATKAMYGKMAGVALRNKDANTASAAAVTKYEADAAAAIKATTKRVSSELTQLTNVMTANAAKAKRQMEVLTGVINTNAAADKEDRGLIREQIETIGVDTQKRITRAIQTGEARAKGIAEAAAANLKNMNTAMLVEITEKVEQTADNLFATIQGDYQKIADNYLSLKAYALASSSALTDYRAKGSGKKLSSLGDVLATVAGLKDIKEKATTGLGSGADSVPAIFTSAKVPVKMSVSKINALVNEYTGVVNEVRMRFPLGLGKYLLKKLQESMDAKGVLQVDKIDKKEGNWVFLNGHAVGLSNKLNDFEDLAVSMGVYEKRLAKITAALTATAVKRTNVLAKPTYAKAPEWNGK